MDLVALVEDLAAAYRVDLSEPTTRRYLKSLEQWRLTSEQWKQVLDRALLRHPRFPSIADMFRIACEVKYP